MDLSIGDATRPRSTRGRLKRLLATALLGRRREALPPAGQLERRQVPDGRADWSDSFYFMGASAPDAPPVYTFLRLGFRAHLTECWLHLWTEQTGGLDLGFEEAPASAGLAAGGLSLACETPGQAWRLAYDGPLTDARGRTHAAVLRGRFQSSAPLHDFDAGTPPVVIGRALAGEPWSRDFFTALQAMHQVHYEQLGTLSLTLTLDGVTSELRLRSVRDHSYGPRRWDDLRGHCWLTGAMDDGSTWNLTLVNLPHLRHVLRGYRHDGARSIPVVDGPTLEALFAHGRPPEAYPLWFRTADGVRHELEVRRVADRRFHLGNLEFHEGMADFTCGTARGRGISEFSFPR